MVGCAHHRSKVSTPDEGACSRNELAVSDTKERKQRSERHEGNFMLVPTRNKTKPCGSMLAAKKAGKQTCDKRAQPRNDKVSSLLRQTLQRIVHAETLSSKRINNKGMDQLVTALDKTPTERALQVQCRSVRLVDGQGQGAAQRAKQQRSAHST